MRRTVIVAVLSSVLSTLLTLAAVGVLRPAPAAAQDYQAVRAQGFEVVDHEGKLRAYFGFGHVDSVGLWVHDKREWQRVSIFHTYDDQARIEVRDAAGNLRWRAP